MSWRVTAYRAVRPAFFLVEPERVHDLTLRLLRAAGRAAPWMCRFASGVGEPSRVPSPHLPEGLHLDRFEGAGEVQTPVLGDAARRLAIGDRVYFRHTKAGELCERFDSLHLVEGGEIVDVVPTYRGEGKTFL